MESGFHAVGVGPKTEPVIDMLRILLGVFVVASLATIVAYVIMFLAVAAGTCLRGSRRDPLADELDEFLAGLCAVDGGWLPGSTRQGRRSS